MPQRDSGLHVPGGDDLGDNGGGQGFTTLVNLYQSDILAIEKVVMTLNTSQGRNRNLQGFVDEVEGRFAEIGLKVEVVTFQNELPPFEFGFNLVVRERMDPEPFDHTRMAWEVQHDLVGLDGAGAMTKDGKWIEPSKSISMATKPEPKAG